MNPGPLMQPPVIRIYKILLILYTILINSLSDFSAFPMTESTLVPIAPAPPVALVGASTSTANYQNQKQAGTKRKRNDAQEPSGPDSGSTQSKKARDGPKKKKANRACFHCQKAHLTCDDCLLSSACKLSFNRSLNH